MLILLVQNWSFYDNLGSNLPQDVHNLHTGSENQIGKLILPCRLQIHENGQKWAPIGLLLRYHKNGQKGSHMDFDQPR